MSDASAAAAAPKTIDPSINVREEVTDALYLLDYAIAHGVKGVDGRPIPADLVSTIKTTAGKMGFLGDTPPGPMSAADWATFEMAYYDLSTLLAPVTADTLRNTRFVPYHQRDWGEHLAGYSPAIAFTRLLWLITIFFAGFVIWSTWYLGIMAEQADTARYLRLRTFIEVTTPWMFGGLGACTFLLRSAHVYIYQRCFDIRRKPEYLNRILLGALAGGAIMLFVAQITDDTGNVIKLSAAALGFLTGYNTDFLFATIERVMAALLPKVGVDSVQKARAPSTQPVDLNDLAKRMDAATGPEKELYKSLIAQLTGTRAPR